MSHSPNSTVKKSKFKRHKIIAGLYIERCSPGSEDHVVNVLGQRYEARVGNGLRRDAFFRGQRLTLLRPSEDRVTIVAFITESGMHECSTDAPDEVRAKANNRNGMIMGVRVCAGSGTAYAG